MTVVCSLPDPDLGVALRLSIYLDCQSRSLGENGFQALTGGPVLSGLLAGTVTIFVALIGYRMILGEIPQLRDGVRWAVRLGFVLALATSWPAFQTLVFRVATDGPEEVAAILLPAIGVPDGAIGERVQGVYDMIRLGGPSRSSPPAQISQSVQGSIVPANPEPASAGAAVVPLPQTASLLVVSTLGLSAAFRLAVGFLIAIAPIAILCLLFDGSLGVFNGWVRALIGAALAGLAVTVTSAIELVAVETELLHVQAVATGTAPVTSLDPEALVTTILLFTPVALVAALAAVRMGSAFALKIARPLMEGRVPPATKISQDVLPGLPAGARRDAVVSYAGRARSASMADALASAADRDRAHFEGRGAAGAGDRRVSLQSHEAMTAAAAVPIGIAGRRSSARSSQSARKRDLSV